MSVCGVRIAAHENAEAWLVGADLLVDPGLVVGHSGVDSRELGQPTATAKTHNPTLDPPCVIFGHQRAA